MIYCLEDGEWVDVDHEFELTCCDCGLVHNVEYEVISGGRKTIRLRIYRNDEATFIGRRDKKEQLLSLAASVKEPIL